MELRDGDIIVVTCKLVSKCLGLLVNINDVKPLPRALVISSKAGIDPWFIELLLRERDELLVAISVKELADKGIINIYGPFEETRDCQENTRGIPDDVPCFKRWYAVE